ncbi:MULTISPECIES: N4-gp56 family major capsid protein [Bartonella]|uniref:N4-gp56 family major capsid protein n=1 Tax=Bartonella TaxID=773 RepID=UPI00295E250D|nr:MULTISPECIES: N4-gp56 family major capsid protein [Bartonella]
MAITTVRESDLHSMGTWSKILNVEVSKAIPIAPLIGKDSNSIIQLKTETQKGKGDSVIFSLRAQMLGRGVSSGQVLEGNEEALQFLHDRLYIDELAHAARVANEGSIDQQRTVFNLREEAKNALVDWYADRLSLMFFIHACGYTAPTISFEERVIDIEPVYYGFNEPTEPSGKRIIRPDGKTKDEDLTDKAKHSFSLKLIDEAVKCAKLANPKIRPVRVNGDSVYVMYLHPTQVMQLRTNTDKGEWLDIQRAVYSGSRSKNPIFDGSLGMYNGVVLRESEHVTHGVKSTDKTMVSSVRRAVFLGAQSVVMAFGNNRGVNRYKLEEEYFDYKREYGLAAKTLIGMKKTRFVFSGLQKQEQDFATIVIPTYSGETAS